jgi:formate dehydrogenase subunit delta
MDIDHLVKMANQIGEFFEKATTREEAISSVAQHLRNFWEPRMRQEIIAYANRGDGELKDIVREAVLRLDAASRAG